MTDVVSKEVRSRMMSGIRAKDTKPELTVRRALTAIGFRYRLHRRDLPGAPDVVMPGRRVAIFVNGCFWHRHEGCRLSKIPASNGGFWRDKLARNAERDAQAVKALLDAGWRVLTVWECATRHGGKADLAGVLMRWILGTGRRHEVSAALSETVSDKNETSKKPDQEGDVQEERGP